MPEPTTLPVPLGAGEIDVSRRIFMGIVGPPLSGKTTSAMSFPNPVILDCDGNLGRLSAPGVLTVPIYNSRFCKEVLKGPVNASDGSPNMRLIVWQWLQKEAVKLTTEQTLIVDSWTKLQGFVHNQIWQYEPEISKTKGEVDTRGMWGTQLDWSRRIMQALKALSCNVVVLFHQNQFLDEQGRPLGKYLPLQQGQFVAELSCSFDDFIRQVAESKINYLKQPSTVYTQYYDMCNKARCAADDTIYLWQVKRDGQFDARSRISSTTPFIPATYTPFKA